MSEQVNADGLDREVQRRSDILEAARGLFRRYGYRKTTMDDIARAAGITKPTIYSYFKGKKDIIAGLVEWEGAQVLKTGLAGQDENASAEEQLAGMFLAVDRFLEEDTFLQGIASRDPDIITPEVINIAFGFERRIMEAVERILAKGIAEGTIRKTDPRLLSYAIVRLHEAFTFTAFLELDGYSKERVNEFFVEMMAATMRP
ncbi:MAG: TetR/AcrR family transcriptional regulator [Actinobacteria bacterium]|nr:TetR/AcrR family transcriptional regulator [Actinomycetota bacterium]MBU1945204.1 TetR/AcrR family transcriptional regulator [Actinomycetota bacterium]MBU2687742.1 TetR/AcrR family transcriptional regulator [Actinomycetota bacterium]